MPTVAKGEVRFSGGHWRTRVTLKGKKRLDLKFVHLTDPEQKPEAERRSIFVAEQAARLRRAGKIETLAARSLLEQIAAEEDELGPEQASVVDKLCGTKGDPLAARGGGVTFGQFAKRWTDGELATEHPDYVKTKKTSDLDAARLKVLCGLDVGGVKLGDVGLQRFTVEHADAAMRQLPKRAKRPATRRHYAQLMYRVLGLAVSPCRIIKISPLPRGFLPSPGNPPVYPYLYPNEDRALLGHTSTPIGWRLFWGFLSREGCRVGEACKLRFGDGVDLKEGTIDLDENKTDDARSWPMNAHVRAALAAWFELRKAKRGDFVFAEAAATPDYKIADLVRDHLKAAGVDRAALFEKGTNTGALRAHDLRGTFVTLNLAAGKTYDWISSRTGHQSSAMINRYKRAKNKAAEMKHRSLDPLDRAIPDLPHGPSPTGSPTERRPTSRKK